MAGRPKRADGRNAKTVAHNNYAKNNYDRILIALEKTEKEKLTIAAKLAGQSLAQYVSEACNRRIEEDSIGNPVLIGAMQRYYEDVLLPARSARDERASGKNAPERIPRPELCVHYSDDGEALRVTWSIPEAE